MKWFLLFLCLAAAEKLDRTYLPPPGAKFSGGAPGDIQVPFEIPKETYSTTLRPNVYNNGVLSPEDTRIEVGINRGVPSKPGTSGDVTTGPQDYYQNTYKVPTTTTSYAFTTTTTHPPGEAYETTTGLINPVTGLPTTTFDYPTSAPGFLNPNVYNPGNLQGTFQPNQTPGRVPSGRPTQYPVTTTLAPGSQFIDQNRPGFIQGSLERVPVQRPGVIPGSVQRPSTTPGASQTQYQGNRYPVSVPGIGQQNSLFPSTAAPGTVAPTTFAPGTFAPTSFAPGTTPSSVQYGGDLNQGVISNQNVPFSQENIPTGTTSGAQRPYYPGNQPQYVSSGQKLPQGISQQPGQSYEIDKDGVIPQQYPISQMDEYGRPVSQNNVYQSFSTASPTTPVPSLSQFPGSTPGSQPSVTAVYPSSSYPTAPGIIGNQGIQAGLISRPERPQAEADRNAVILNYENVITPEGFAYSFDTSNGIHADESGTAVDGVKAKGSYSYIGDDGKLYSVVYTADENGFQPRGDHLPTSPPIPEAILKVIEQAKKDQEAGVSDDGTYDEDKYGHTKYDGERYRPQRPNKINIDGKVPDRYDAQYNQVDRKQQIKPQKGTKGPVSVNQYYEDMGEDQGQVNGNVVYSDQRKPTQQKPSRRPANRVPDANNEQYNQEIVSGEGSGDKFIDDKISSQYPITQPGDDTRQLGGKFSVQRPGQYTESDNDNLRPGQVGFDTNQPGYKTSQDNYSTSGSRSRPIDGQSIQSSDVILKENFDRRPQYDNNRRPTGTLDGFNRPGSETSSQRPSQYPSDSGVYSIPSSSKGKYGNRIRPVTSMAQFDDETDAFNYQDSRRPGGLDKYLPNKTYTAQPISSSTTIAPVSSQNNRPTLNQLPSRIPGSVYDSVRVPEPAAGRPATNDATSYQYSSRPGRPQSSITPIPQQGNAYYGNRLTEEADNQNRRPPVPSRRPAETTRYTTVTPIEEEGYQYLPPQRKFSQESNRLGGSQMTLPYGKPSQDRTYYKEGEVPKPFTTPDASRSEEGTEDDNGRPGQLQYGQGEPSRRPITTQKPYETYDKESSSDKYDETRPQRPDQGQDEGYGTNLDASRIPDDRGQITTFGSTRRPPYQQIQTTRPQQQYRPGSVFETTQSIPSGTLRPQEGDRFVTSTPEPSQSTRFEITQPSFRPGQQTTDRYIAGQTPSTPSYFAQTTKLPPQSSGQFYARPTQNVYEQQSSHSPYQTTYRPMVTYSGSDADEAPVTTIRPGRPFGRPSYSQNQVPSTTYRPAYYPGKEADKQVMVDNFGRPLPQQPIDGEYLQGTSITPGDVTPSSQSSRRIVQGQRPVVDMYGRPTRPGQGNVPYAGPEGSSTTEKIIGEDFSGPKQQQTFDPERGYYY